MSKIGKIAKTFVFTAVMLLFGSAGAIDILDVGTTGIPNDPNVSLIDRGDGSYALVFTNPQTTTFTFKNQFLVTEALIVGGGGSGGGNCGAGGGAGGFVYFDNLETGVSVGDAISVTVGAGGAVPATRDLKGLNGESSVLALGGMTYTALGGGGGGSWNYWEGNAGGSGGGSCAWVRYAATTQNSTTGYGLGSAGGAGGGSNLSGGGGGAGDAGGNAEGSKCGDGGPGIECSITGEPLYYAAGGGGSSRSNTAGKGGSGIGGDGAVNGVMSPVGSGCGFPGKDGTGSGGGGGESQGAGFGGGGGSGIVVLAIRPDTSVTLAVALHGDPGMNFFKLDLTPSSDGGDGSGYVSLRGGWALDGLAIPDNEIAASVPVLTGYPLTVTGLVPGGTYNYSFYSQNSKGEKSKVATGQIVLTSGAIGGAPGSGGTVTKLANGDAVHVFTESGTLVLPEDYGSARVLIVGGGGAGGGNCGGGGGAGGFVELTGLNLTAGSYAVTVGAGGQVVYGKANNPNATVNKPGADGEDSTLTIGDVVYRALGGGGGGCWGNAAGRSGGSGGGSENSATVGASLQNSQIGYGLGNAGAQGGNGYGGGGGGAGGPGVTANGTMGGVGGPGKSSDITGSPVFYAAGGGAGGNGKTSGAGGSDIGGRGGENGDYGPVGGSPVADYENSGKGYGYPGKDGTGSGGGGSSGGGGIGGSGGAGGSGIVIVRYHYTKDVSDQDEPSVSFGLGAISGNTVTIPYTVAWPGKGKETCSAKIAYGLAADDLRYEQDLGAGRIGEETATLGNLIPGRHYCLKIVVSNGDYSVESEVMDFDVSSTAPVPTAYPVGMPVIAGDGSGCVTAAGEDATFAGTFAQFVEGTAVKLHYLDGETWKESTATVVGANGFSGAFSGLTTGLRYSYYLTAEAATGVDRTGERTFLVGGTVKLAKAVSVSSPTREITVTGSLERYEVEDPVTVTLMIKLGDTWTACGSKQLSQQGEFSITYDGAESFAFGESYEVKLTLAAQESDVASFTAQDTLTYTWRNRDGVRYWNDPDNWTPSDTSVKGAGYPVLGSTAKFANNAVTTVRVSRAETAALLDFANTKYLRLLGTADDAAVTADLRTGGSVAVILDHVAVSEVKTGNSQDPYHGFADNGEFALENGAVLNARGNWMPFSNGLVFRVASGSTFNLLSGANNFWFGGNGSRFVLDDATAIFETTFDLNNKNAGGDLIEIKGAHPLLQCKNGMRFIGSGMGPTTIAFDIPKEGFAETPIQVAGNMPFPGAQTDGERVTLSVADESKFFRKHSAGRQQLMETATDIDGTRLDFDATYRDLGTFSVDEGRRAVWFDARPVPRGLIMRIY